MKNSLLYIFALLFTAIFCYQSFGQTTTVQGVLRDLVGRSVDDGNYELTFKLYTVSSGGTAFWTETQSTVPVSSGVFSVKLGAVTPITNISATQTYYLGVITPGGGEMIPRIELTKSFSAMSSLSVTNTGDVNITGNDDNTGGGDIVMKTGDTERIRISNSNGEILVGSPTKGIKMFNWGNYVDLMSVGTKLSLNYGGNDVIANVGSGNFGIGTTTPSSKLEVDGDIRITNSANGLRFGDGSILTSASSGSTGNVSNNSSVSMTYNADNSGANEVMTLNNGSTEVMRLSTDNKVGIGTNNPSQKLEVYNGKAVINGDGSGDVGSGGTLQVTASNSNKPYVTVANASNSVFSIGADQDAAIIGWDDNAQNLQFRRNITWNSFPNTGDVAMTILGSNGNIGIGTTNPTDKLHVIGSIRGDKYYDDDPNYYADLNAGGNLGGNWTFGGGITHNGSDFKLGLNDGRSIGSKTQQRTLVHDANDELVINFDGDFEGGTIIGGSGSVNLFVSAAANGNVGIGTKSPTSKLDINSATDPRMKFRVNNSASSFTVGYNVGNNEAYVWNEFFSDLVFGTNNSWRMKILASGGIYRWDNLSFFSTTSDKRTKKDITVYKGGLDLLQRLEPVKFKYNGKGGTIDDGTEHISFIAQDIEQIPELAPLMVQKVNMKLDETDANTTEMLTLNTSALQFILVNAIKEQQKQIEELKAEIQELKKK